MPLTRCTVFSLSGRLADTGTGVNSDFMTVNLLVVPEPGTLGLLGLAACCLLRNQGGMQWEIARTGIAMRRT